MSTPRTGLNIPEAGRNRRSSRSNLSLRDTWAMRWMRNDRRAMVGVSYLALVVLAALIGPRGVGVGPNAQDLDKPNLGLGSPGHFLGTDDLGRDLLSRLLSGASISLRASLIAVSVGLALGLVAGLVAGYRGGILDAVIMRLADTILSFPLLIFVIALTSIAGPGITWAMIAMGIFFAPVFARLIRSTVLQVREQTYVKAAITFGAGDWWIIRRHVLPNSIQPVIVQAALFLAAALLAEASLSFLGLGVQPPDPAWGSMLGRGFGNRYDTAWQMIPPGLAIMLTAWAFNTVGDSLRDATDPRSSRRVVKRSL